MPEDGYETVSYFKNITVDNPFCFPHVPKYDNRLFNGYIHGKVSHMSWLWINRKCTECSLTMAHMDLKIGYSFFCHWRIIIFPMNNGYNCKVYPIFRHTGFLKWGNYPHIFFRFYLQTHPALGDQDTPSHGPQVAAPSFASPARASPRAPASRTSARPAACTTRCGPSC